MVDIKISHVSIGTRIMHTFLGEDWRGEWIGWRNFLHHGR